MPRMVPWACLLVGLFYGGMFLWHLGEGRGYNLVLMTATAFPILCANWIWQGEHLKAREANRLARAWSPGTNDRSGAATDRRRLR